MIESDYVFLKIVYLMKEKAKNMKEVTVQELKEMIDRNEDFQLIDVREPFEYEVSNLNGLNIPLAGIVIESDKVSKDKPVIIQCRSGKRSAQAVMLLEQQGFDNLANLTGGILAWKDEIDPEMDVY
jgi:rhodanese-related sulfurtransferase